MSLQRVAGHKAMGGGTADGRKSGDHQLRWGLLYVKMSHYLQSVLYIPAKKSRISEPPTVTVFLLGFQLPFL